MINFCIFANYFFWMENRLNDFIITLQNGALNGLLPWLDSSDLFLLRISCKLLKEILPKAKKRKTDDSYYKFDKLSKFVLKKGYFNLYITCFEFEVHHDLTSIPFTENDEKIQLELINKHLTIHKDYEDHAIESMQDEIILTEYGGRELCNNSAWNGNFKLLKLAIEKWNCLPGETTTKYAAMGGYLNILEFLHEKNLLVLDEEVCFYAAIGKSLDALKWLREKNCPWDIRTCSSAAGRGDLNTLDWAMTNGCDYNHEEILVEAISNRHFEIIIPLFKKGVPWNSEVSAQLAESGQLDLLKFGKENGRPIDKRTFKYAAMGAKIEVLKWLKEINCPCDHKVCEAAARFGHLEILKWLKLNEFPWSDRLFEIVAGEGRDNHYDILKWLFKMNEPWDENVISAAQENRHHGIVKWLIKKGCPYNDSDIEDDRDDDNEMLITNNQKSENGESDNDDNQDNNDLSVQMIKKLKPNSD